MLNGCLDDKRFGRSQCKVDYEAAGCDCMRFI